MNDSTAQNMADSVAIDIFNYHDYRGFLNDWIEFKRGEDPKFSLRGFSKDAALSVGYLPLVLSGKRRLTKKTAPKIAKAMKLSNSERTYFVAMVEMSESKSQDDRRIAFERMQKNRGFKQKNMNELEAYKYLGKWYLIAIKELAADPAFKADPKWIRQRLIDPPSLVEVEKALNFLIEHKFIKVVESGDVEVLQKNVKCHDGIFQLSLAENHKQMLERAAKSIDLHDKEKRNLRGYSLALDSGTFGIAVEIINQALGEIAKLEEKQDSTSQKDVYHFEFAGFPLTKNTGGDK